MAVGIHVSDDRRIFIGEDVDNVIKSLEEANVKYQLTYDKVKDGVRETVIDLIDLRSTFQFHGGTLEYLRLNNNDFTYLGVTDNQESVDNVRMIRDNLIKKFELEDYTLTFAKIDLKPMHIVVLVDNKVDRKVRLAIQKDGFGRVFVSTISYAA